MMNKENDGLGDVVLPAILASDERDLLSKISLFKPLGRLVQLDVTDGEFAGTGRWNDPRSLEAGPVDELRFEVHLMIMRPEKHIEEWLKTGCEGMVVHVECVNDISFLKNKCDDFGAYLTLAINNDTEIGRLEKLDGNIARIQAMGIKHVGEQGQEFDERTLGRITAIRNTYPNAIITVDGGVTERTLPRLLRAGASRFVVGSALFGEDREEVIKRLEKMIR